MLFLSYNFILHWPPPITKDRGRNYNVASGWRENEERGREVSEQVGFSQAESFCGVPGGSYRICSEQPTSERGREEERIKNDSLSFIEQVKTEHLIFRSSEEVAGLAALNMPAALYLNRSWQTSHAEGGCSFNSVQQDLT